MNRCNIDFIEKNNIDFSKIDTKIYTKNDINWIINSCEVQGDTYKQELCIEDIVGIDSLPRDVKLKFPEILDNFFDELGDGYHSRSVGLLQYNDKTIIDRLIYSFENEYIRTLELDNGKNLISTNGIHRFLVLRLLYLNAKSKCLSEVELNELKKKFTIPVKTTKVDLTKTYCKFLINEFQEAQIMDYLFKSINEFSDPYNTDIKYKAVKYVGFSTENIYLTQEQYDAYLKSITSLSFDMSNDYKITGKSVIKNCKGQKLILNDDELIEFTRNIILNSKKFTSIVNDDIDFYGFKNAFNTYDSFRKFVQKNFSGIFKLERKEETNYGNNRRL